MIEDKKREIDRFNRASVAGFKTFLTDREITASIHRQVITSNGIEDLIDAFVRDQRCFFTADAGEGKSTAIVASAIDIAEGKVSEMGTVFYVPLYRLNNMRFNSPDILIKWLSENGPAEGFGPDFVSDRFHSKDNVVFLDGLDEIASSIQREAFDVLIKSATDRYPETRFIMISARPWIRSRVLDNFKEYKFKPLSDDDVERLLNQELKRIHPPPNWTPQHIEECMDFFRKTRKDIVGYDSLLRNPSYIRFTALLGGMLPIYAGEFLKDSMEGYLNTAQFHEEDSNLSLEKLQGRERNIGQLARLVGHLLEEMAYLLHESGRRDISLSEIRGLANWRFVEQYDIKSAKRMALSQEEQEKVVTLIANNSPFFRASHTENGERHYYFTHLGVQEYLVGQQLVSNLKSCRDIHRAIEDRINDPWWRQPFVYLLASTNAEDITEPMLNQVIKTGDEKFIADVYMFALGKAIDRTLRKSLEPIFQKFYGKNDK